MPEFPAITHVALTVTSLERSVPWYKGLLARTQSLKRTQVRSSVSLGLPAAQ